MQASEAYMIIVACPCSQTGTFTQPHASQTKPEHAGALARSRSTRSAGYALHETLGFTPA
jgi:hypothetical protein